MSRKQMTLSILCGLALGLTACAATDDESAEGSGATGTGDESDAGGGPFDGGAADGNGGGDESPNDDGGGAGDDNGGDGGDDAADEAGGDGETGDGGSFITPPDGGVAGQCDPAAQDCPEGQKCTSYVATPGQQTVDSTQCVDITGQLQFGEPCTRIEGNDDCDAGFFCMTDVSGNTGEGFCLEYCQPGSACEFGGECFAFNDGALPVCQVSCNPLASSCPPGQGCYAAFDDFVCALPGFPDGGGGQGDTCATIQGCQIGLVCSGGVENCNTESGCCTAFCDLTDGDIGNPACVGNNQCVAALDDPPPGLQDVGICTIPE